MTATKAAVASDQLTRALVAAAARGVRPRCGDYETSHLFLSEDPAERRIATAKPRVVVDEDVTV